MFLFTIVIEIVTKSGSLKIKIILKKYFLLNFFCNYTLVQMYQQLRAIV